MKHQLRIACRLRGSLLFLIKGQFFGGRRGGEGLGDKLNHTVNATAYD